MHTLRRLPFLLLLAGGPAWAQAARAIDDHTLIGAWGQGKPGVDIEQVVEFRADHSFVIYPKCGQETQELKKHGMTAYPAGNWQVDGGHLAITVSFAGQKKRTDSSVAYANGVLAITDDKHQVQAYQRYSKELPPACPLRP
jgi:hypothetical protein